MPIQKHTIKVGTLDDLIEHYSFIVDKTEPLSKDENVRKQQLEKRLGTTIGDSYFLHNKESFIEMLKAIKENGTGQVFYMRTTAVEMINNLPDVTISLVSEYVHVRPSKEETLAKLNL